MLTTKYGNPLFSDEYFNTEYPPSDDGSKIRQLMLDRCNYSTSFSTDNGYIILKITHESYKCYVLLGYLDKINNAYKEEEAIDDL